MKMEEGSSSLLPVPYLEAVGSTPSLTLEDTLAQTGSGSFGVAWTEPAEGSEVVLL